MSRLCVGGKDESDPTPSAPTQSLPDRCLQAMLPRSMCMPCAPPLTPSAGSPQPMPPTSVVSTDSMPPRITAGSSKLAPQDDAGSATVCMPLTKEFTEPKLNAHHLKVMQRSQQRCGHMGVEKTYDAVRQHLSKAGTQPWEGLRAEVVQVVRGCAICQKQSLIRPHVVSPPFTHSSQHPMKHLTIDMMSPFPVDIVGYTYVITIIDCFSLLVELFPAADTTAKAAARVIVAQFGNFGALNEIRSDNDSQYVNGIIRLLKISTHIDFTLTIASSH
jgi:Integrase core domain/Integrase zinc binding domain